MAICNWFPRAAARAQLETVTLGGTWVVGDVANVTINGKSVSFTATTTTAAHMVTGLLAALQASTIIEFSAITWASPTSTTITGTGTTTGVPFTVTVSRTTAGTGTISTATTTAASGVDFWNDANNWDGGAVPANGDTVNVDLSLGSIRYGLSQGSVAPALINIYSRSRTTNVIGLPRTNAAGYVEYRTRELTTAAASVIIDCESPQIYLNTNTAETLVEVRKTGTGTTQGVPAVTWRGVHADSEIEILSGEVGIGIYDGESAQGAVLNIGENATVICGSGCTFADIESRGTLDYGGAFTTLTSKSNTTIVRGSDDSTSISAIGGDIDYRSTGTVTHAYAGGSSPGTIDCSNDLSNRTFTDFTIGQGGSLNDPHQTVTITNGTTLGSSVSSLSAS
jgi:hypothetical protein